MKKPGKRLQNENTEYMAKLCCKLRTSFLLYMSMILLSFLIKKFEFIRPLLHDLRTLMNYTNKQAVGEEEDSPSKIGNKMQSLANIQINLKNLKEVTNTLLGKATKKNKNKHSFDSDSESSEEDAFMQNFVSRPNETDETKENKLKEEEAKKKEVIMFNKMEEFMILWLRQIVIYNTHYVLHLALANSNLTSILDVRPSIVKASSIKYSLTSLMNPRLQSIHQVNNFKSMKRILDNIVSYFFQNFLSVKERAMITEDLSRIRNGGMKMSACKILDFTNFFESDEEFKKFYEFMDMNYYISNVCEFELSLIQHTNKDHSPETLSRVYDVYKNGIEIFKHPGEHITQF